jgi:4-hydroxy-2-oxoglutarate aldolase
LTAQTLKRLDSRLRGILLPTTTPFTDAQELDIEASVSNLRKWARTGITGFVMLGSTGERVHLDEREYLRVLESARNEIPAELAFIAGAGQHSTVGTIREIQKAAELGVDGVLVITPHYYRSAITQDTLLSYYTAVADAAAVPVLLYSMPAFTGIKIEPETIARLSEHPNIVGVKDSSNDVNGFAATVRACPADFAVLTGNGTILFDAFRAGGTGAILAVGCVAPEICVDIYQAFAAADTDRATLLQRASALQTKLTPLAAAVTTGFGIGGLKAALDLVDYHGGAVRAPLRSPDEAARKEIAALLDDAQLAFRATVSHR